jgi:LuxR family maltose regulon positive regulatory protein
MEPDDRNLAHPPYGEDFEPPVEPAVLVAAVHDEDWPQAIDLAKRDWLQLLCNHPNTLRWLFRVVPDEVIAADPVATAGRELLTYVLGRAGEASELPEDPELLSAAARSDDIRALLLVAMVDGILLRASGRYQRSLALADRLATVVTQAAQETPDLVRDLVPSCWMMIGVARAMAGATGPAEVAYRRAYAGHLGSGEGALARAAASGAALCLALDGDAHGGARWLEAESALPEPTGWLAVRGPVPGNVARVQVALDRLDLEEADRAVAALRDVDHREEFWAHAAVAIAEVSLARGQPLAGLQQLEAEVARNRSRLGDAGSRSLIARTSAELLLAGGLGNRAQAVLGAADPDDAGARVTRAKLRLLTGQPADAAAEATAALWREDLAPRIRMEALAVVSAAHLQLDDAATAARELAELVGLVDHYGNRRPLLALPRAALLELVAESGVRPRDLDDLALHSLPDLHAVPVELVALSKREHEVLLALAEGLDPAEIAGRWVVSIATVRSQIHSVYRKLGAHSRREALTRAQAWGLTGASRR